MTPPGDREIRTSRKIMDEEHYFLDYATKEPVDSLARLEDVAKFLVGASATTSGLFAAAFKLTLGDKAIVPGPAGFAPFLLLAASILALLQVLLPQRSLVGHNEPAAWKAAILQARRRKHRWLLLGTWLFLGGIFAAIVPLLQWTNHERTRKNLQSALCPLSTALSRAFPPGASRHPR